MQDSVNRFQKLTSMLSAAVVAMAFGGLTIWLDDEGYVPATRLTKEVAVLQLKNELERQPTLKRVRNKA